jgi:tRNA(Ile)-lysidine synthase
VIPDANLSYNTVHPPARPRENGSTLQDRILATMARYSMLSAGRRVAVAVSGGADSVCLLHLLVDLGLAKRVVHVNHHLRGAESDADAVFVEDLARRLSLPVTVHDAPLPPGSKNLEQTARILRLTVFQSILSSGQNDHVALGHTRSDQAETVLFRFLRGSGTAGLAGIRPASRDGMIRPLIEVDRQDVRDWLRERNIPWREDSTNASPEFARNRIRHGLLPQLAREWNPAIVDTLARTADWADAEEAYWQEELLRVGPGCLETVEADEAVLLRVEGLRCLPRAVARRLVRRAMELAKGDLRSIDFQHVDTVLQLASGPEGGRSQVPGLDICRSFDWIRLAPPRPALPYRIAPVMPGTTPVPGAAYGVSLELIEKSETSATEDSVYNGKMGCLDWKSMSGNLELRNWQPGDRYQPNGSSGEEKITDLFQQARVPLWERAQWPVLEDRSGIIWVRRFGPAAARTARSQSSVVLRVQEVTAR